MLAAGCDKPKSPDTVAHDVATAEQKASTELAKSEQDASKDVGKAADNVGDKLTDLNTTAATDYANVAIAKADSDRNVARAKWSAWVGQGPKTLKEDAHADYHPTKANAQAE